jgi:hypothetical protein
VKGKTMWTLLAIVILGLNVRAAYMTVTYGWSAGSTEATITAAVAAVAMYGAARIIISS